MPIRKTKFRIYLNYIKFPRETFRQQPVFTHLPTAA
jgi:hypothetical protein